MVMVAGDDNDLGAGLPQPQQGLDHQVLCLGGRCRGLVDVAGHQNRVNLVRLGDPDYLGQDGPLLLKPVAALEGLPDVPVGGMHKLHGLRFPVPGEAAVRTAGCHHLRQAAG